MGSAFAGDNGKKWAKKSDGACAIQPPKMLIKKSISEKRPATSLFQACPWNFSLIVKLQTIQPKLEQHDWSLEPREALEVAERYPLIFKKSTQKSLRRQTPEVLQDREEVQSPNRTQRRPAEGHRWWQLQSCSSLGNCAQFLSDISHPGLDHSVH